VYVVAVPGARYSLQFVNMEDGARDLVVEIKIDGAQRSAAASAAWSLLCRISTPKLTGQAVTLMHITAGRCCYGRRAAVEELRAAQTQHQGLAYPSLPLTVVAAV
jgi:hypothetical protein